MIDVCVLVFYVTCNDISVIYVTAQMCRRTEKEVVPTVGLFNVPVQAPTQGHPFYTVIPRNRPI